MQSLLIRAIDAFRRGEVAESESLCDEVLRLAPHRADALTLRGALLRRVGRLDEAAEAYRQALQVKPDYADAHANLGNLLRLMRRNGEAICSFQKALELSPGNPQWLSTLAEALRESQRLQEAESACRNALAINPRFAEAHLHLGNALLDQSRYVDAAAAYRNALRMEPHYAEAWYNLGNALQMQGLIAEAAECYRKALQESPDFVRAHSNLLFSLQYDPREGMASLFSAHREWDERHGRPRRARSTPNVNQRDPERRLHIGYVSADFGAHPVGYFLLPILPALDHSKVTTFCYSNGGREDAVTLRLKAHADGWRDVTGLDDGALAALIRSDGIDILVDLSGHTAGNRLPLFTLKPAPIQVTWAGYVGTTGLSAIDYLISDERETPYGVDPWYQEAIVRLPDDYVCFEPAEYSPAVAPLPALANGHLTFGSFNNLPKVNEEVVALWSRILTSNADARLLLVTRALGDAQVRERYLKLFASHGVGEDRLELLGALPHRELLQSYNRIDVALDPFPYSGGLTTLESLWMGVPVLTLGGERFCSRHSVSHLCAVGLREWVVADAEAYVERARTLASDLATLAAVRSGLRARVASSPLRDGARFARNLEAAYRLMWRRWCAGLEPVPVAFAGGGDPRPGPLLDSSILALNRGEVGRAERLCQELLQQEPRRADGWTLAGVVQRRLGNNSAAIAAYRHAIALDPVFADAHHNLANALRAEGGREEAVAAYRHAVELRPDWAEALNNLGDTLRELHRLDEAEEACRRATTLRPNDPHLQLTLGNVLKEAGRLSEAAERYRAALGLKEKYPEACYNLAVTLRAQGDHAAAIAPLEQAVALRPRWGEAQLLLANTLHLAGFPGRALDIYANAVALLTDKREALLGMAAALQGVGRYGEAVGRYREALAAGLDTVQLHLNLGNALHALRRYDGAIASYRRVLELDPGELSTRLNIAHLMQKLCRWEGMERWREEIVEPLLQWREGKEPPPFFPILSLPVEMSAGEQLQIARHFASTLRVPEERRWRHEGRASHPRLRIAYLSTDFRNHAVAHLMAGVYKRHDRSRFELFAYALSHADGSDYRRRVEAECDHFTDITGWPLEEAARRIHDDGIDILIDLNGYTGDARPFILAFRPAPVQVNYLGEPGTMGADFIDYIIADRVVIPPEEEGCYSERVVYLPHSYQANDRDQPIAAETPARADYALPDGAFVFCCFNSPYKIEPRIFSLWMEILREVPGSVLWLFDGNPEASANLRKEAAARGIDPARLLFAPGNSKPHHLARHRLADLFLDTWFYNGHTTCSDALWAGLPVITCPGRTFASRVGASLLQAVGLPELVVKDFDAYRRLAIHLATHREELARLKLRLADLRLTSPLFDTDAHVRHLEEAYAAMWARRQAGLAPARIEVGRMAGERPPAAAQSTDPLRLLQRALEAFRDGDDEGARQRCEEVLRRLPGRADGWTLLGALERKAGHPEEALRAYRRAIELMPDYPDAHNNLGSLHTDMGRLEEAEACYRKAIGLAPGRVEFYVNLGSNLQSRGRLDEAEDAYLQAIALNPEDVEANWNLSLLRLLQGDYRRGFEGYQWRWQARLERPAALKPEWRGEPAEGRRILVYTEQGFGDVIQFVRYLPLVRERCGGVVLEVRPELERLLARAPGVESLYRRGDQPLPGFDLQCALLDLPAILNTTLATIPGAVPYLDADPALIEHWKRRLGEAAEFKVGVVWAGNPNVKNDRWRSPHLRPLLPLFDLPGIRLFSLQKGAGREELEGIDLPDHFVDLAPEIGDFADTAAILANLDLVITSDTSVAHLAGALGVQGWVLLHFNPDWRWMRDRADSPWYPTLRLFRQREPGRWEGVAEEVREGLIRLTNESPRKAGGAVPPPEREPKDPSKRRRPSPPVRSRERPAARGDEAIDGQGLALFQQAQASMQRGDAAEAERLCRGAMARLPGRPEPWTLLGILLRRSGRREEALAAYRKAIALQPSYADARNNLGNLLREMGRHAEAAEAYVAALELRPQWPEARSALADVLRLMKRFDEAEAEARRAVATAPGHAEAHLTLGNVMRGKGDLRAAEGAYREAIRLDPNHLGALSNLGLALKDLERYAEAESALRAALTLDPGAHEPLLALAATLEAQGRLADATEVARRVVELRPEGVGGYVPLGNLLMAQSQLEEAERAYRKAVELDPRFAPALLGLGTVFYRLGRAEEAVEWLKRALAEAPELAEAHNNLGNVYKDMGRSEEAVACYRAALAIRPQLSDVRSNLLLVLNYVEGCSREEIFAEHLRYDELHIRPLAHLIEPHANDPDPERRLKVGYLSADLRRHAVAYYLEGVFEHHDHERFEIRGYYNYPLSDHITRRIKGHMDGWVECAGLTDDELAARIRADGIDILVDLSGHSAKNRLLVFGRKPAPVQVSWIGYPNTTGLSTIDYRISDLYAEPEGVTDPFCTERIIRLPDTGAIYRPADNSPDPIDEAPAFTNGFVTFGSFNNFAKVTPRVISVWSAVLREVPDARLFIEAPGLDDKEFRRQVCEQFAAHGIGEERLELVARHPANHYKFYNRVDVCLDPFPYNGGTTSCDTVWMGVPFVSLCGNTVVSRIGITVLHNVGLPELVAHSDEEYVAIAVRIGTDRDWLREMRGRLARERLKKMPLFDGERFVNNLESAYRRMWRDWCVGKRGHR